MEVRKYKIFISALDHSAEVHCANLIKAVKSTGLDVEFIGIGGEKIAQAGCEIIENPLGKSVMIYKTFAMIGYYYKLLRRAKRKMKDADVDLAIVCDSPSFNFHIAKAAKKLGKQTLFYVAPQVWAWARWRVPKLRRRCDRLACILPFEEQWFRERRIKSDFVGNPLFDALDAVDNAKDYSGFDADGAKIVLLPGSRKGEIETLWQPMQEIALKIKEKYPNVSFTTVAVNPEIQGSLQQKEISGFECSYTTDSVCDISKAVDFSLTASGSATLEVAAAACPMVIMYQSSRLLWYMIGWWLVQTRLFSLVNILAQRKLVPEFMPYFKSIEPIAETCVELLGDKGKLAKTSSELIEISRTLVDSNASENTAKIVIEMLRADIRCQKSEVRKTV